MESPKPAPDNPMQTDGFEFIEYAAPDPRALGRLFETLGFRAIARHRHKDVLLYRQGEINFIVNAEPRSFAQHFARRHGPSVCAIAFRVKDAAKAYARARDLDAWLIETQPGPMELSIPAIKGVGDSLIYLVDRYPENAWGRTIYDVDFVPLPGHEAFWMGKQPAPAGVGLAHVDHLTNNVHRGRMTEWAEFYERLFGFREIRYFDIEGKLTGLKSRAMTSPCGKIRIPINESSDDRSQVEEYLNAYRGEGIQHIALATDDIYATVDALRAGGVKLLDTPDTYYEQVASRLPGHREPLEELRRRRILIDGSPGGGILLQIFTETVIGPIFFEIIQRKGDEGFGEGNFRALFESIEADQIRRGVLDAQAKWKDSVSNAPVEGLRGDYSDAGEDCVVEQRWSQYGPEEHELWRRLYERQMRLVPGYACDAYLGSLAALDASREIPDFAGVSRALERATGWTLAAVPGLIPDLVFFRHLSQRRFPVTRWLRRPEEFDYIVEPDVFHDFFGHVPMLFNPVFGDYMQAYGLGGLKAARLDALTMLARLYWYTVEFGLIAAPEGPRIYGAGILSSGGEVVHSIDSKRPRRIAFDLERVMRTDYHIDRFQDTYFVIDDFEQLFRETARDFAPIYARLRDMPAIPA